MMQFGPSIKPINFTITLGMRYVVGYGRGFRSSFNNLCNELYEFFAAMTENNLVVRDVLIINLNK